MGAIVPEIVNGGAMDRGELRERAYVLWAWECKHNSVKTSARLSELYGQDVPDATIRSWAKVDNWAIRHEEERADLQPAHIRPVAALKLGRALINAAAYVEDVFDGIRQPDRDMNALAKIVFDATGFSAIRVDGSEAKHATQSARERTDYASLSPAELADRERRLRLPASAAE